MGEMQLYQPGDPGRASQLSCQQKAIALGRQPLPFACETSQWAGLSPAFVPMQSPRGKLTTELTSFGARDSIINTGFIPKLIDSLKP
jgi:hypothetical protein